MLQIDRKATGLTVWLLALAASACDGSGGSAAQIAQAQAAISQPGTPAQNLVQSYLKLQLKLAQDDQAGAHSAFAGVQSAVADKGLTLEPALQKRIASAAEQGAAATKIEATRAAFGQLSQALLAYLATATNPLQQPLTVAFCPMAFDNKGAKWLQLGEKLQNPYFGSEMLTCGSVDSSLKPGKKL